MYVSIITLALWARNITARCVRTCHLRTLVLWWGKGVSQASKLETSSAMTLSMSMDLVEACFDAHH